MLHVHRSERTDALVAGLGEVLRVPPADPFQPDVVAVPTRGVERWITQRLSHLLGTTGSVADGPAGASPTGSLQAADSAATDSTAPGDGVCANVLFPRPAELVAGVLAAAGGSDPDADPWAPDRLVWTLLEVIDECAGEPWCAPLGDHLGVGLPDPGHRRGRRMATATHLAHLYDGYAANRPAMLREWAGGADTDGAGGRLGADLRWQAELWRHLRAMVATPSPAERLPEATAWLRAHPGDVDLPERVSVFGPTRLAGAQLDVLVALAAHRDVHLWLPHPSASLWERVASYDGQHAAGPVHRRADSSAQLPRNPLLASLGRDARELQLQLAAATPTVVEHTYHPAPPRPATLLGRLQQAIQDDAPLGPAAPPGDGRGPQPPRAGAAPPESAAPDGSLQVHACHGPARQVEVLREVLVGLLADDPTLEPRDVLVMCPDIETYAPLISATFGLAGPEPPDEPTSARHPGHLLRVRLADRALRQTNPLLATLATLLDLAPGRLTASEVLDLAAAPPVRRRFDFADDELDRLAEWVEASGVRWGLDAAHRAHFGLEGLASNTWRAGLDRLLLGVAMSEDDQRYVAHALPLDDVDSADIDLAGRFAEFVDRLAGLLARLTGEHPLADWLATLTDALDQLTAVADAQEWADAQARRTLTALAEAAADRGGLLLLSLPDVRALLADPLAGHPTRANFRTGHLTVCSMHPMRSVPHRVICLLGLDDGAFPRAAHHDGEDVLARDPLVGERDPRSEDRQLLLDAILAATEKLVILYTGADPRTNTPRPPAVPVGEILDALGALGAPPAGGAGEPAGIAGTSGQAGVVVHHPLQPFDARNFTPGRLGSPGRAFSFDRQAYDGARRAGEPRAPRAPFLPAPLPPLAETDVALDDLVGFLEHPVAAFLRQRLGVTLARDSGELAEAMVAELDGLTEWQIGDRILRARLAGADPLACQQAEWRRGALPPGRLGQAALGTVMAQVEPLVTLAAPLRTGPPDTLDVTARLGARGRTPTRVTGTVGGVQGHTILRVEYSRLAPRHRLRAWAALLALTVARPGPAWTAVTIGRGAKQGGARGRGGDHAGGQADTPRLARSTLGPVDPDVASEHLAVLVDLRARGLCAPLPLPVRTAATYAERRFARGQPVDAAVSAAERYEWRSGDYQTGEQDDEAHRQVWGDQPELAVLLGEPPGPDERWLTDEPTRFGQLTRRLWDPLLAAETLETL